MVPNTIKYKLKSYTEFQQKVWTACAEIPSGQTRTYQWIARKIGHPKAVRAVGAALGKNPFVPIIPCHRVVRSDGKLGGYSGPGGLKTKAKMLRDERARIK
ncbi:MAG: Methylated-DNA--protein-cysteine methyltransferase [Elusimicrobia bacterium]|nr:Methylated-DNA--protein-cysteine methyltransferase [Elusimicrobiota bacterium]